MHLSQSMPNLKLKKLRIQLDSKKVKSEILILEEEIEEMYLKYEYMDCPMKVGWWNFLELYQKFWKQHVQLSIY